MTEQEQDLTTEEVEQAESAAESAPDAFEQAENLDDLDDLAGERQGALGRAAESVRAESSRLAERVPLESSNREKMQSELAAEDEEMAGVLEETESESKALLVSEAITQLREPGTTPDRRAELAVYVLGKSPDQYAELGLSDQEQSEAVKRLAEQDPASARRAFEALRGEKGVSAKDLEGIAWTSVSKRPELFAQAIAAYGLRSEILLPLAVSLEDKLGPTQQSAILRAVSETHPNLFPVLAESFRTSGDEIVRLLNESPKDVQQSLRKELGIGSTMEEDPELAAWKEEKRRASLESASPEAQKHETFMQERASELATQAERVSEAVVARLESQLAAARNEGNETRAQEIEGRIRFEQERRKAETELMAGYSETTNLGGGINTTKVMHFEGRTMPGVYKPIRGEREGGRSGIETGAAAANEWKAGQVDRIFGFNVVPATVIREGPNGMGSVQDWKIGKVGAQVMDEKGSIDAVANPDQLHELILFDFLIRNTDRNFNNYVVEPGGRVWGIDNGFAMSTSKSAEFYSSPMLDKTLRNEAIPENILNRLAEIRKDPEMMAALKQTLETATPPKPEQKRTLLDRILGAKPEKRAKSDFDQITRRLDILLQAKTYQHLESVVDALDNALLED